MATLDGPELAATRELRPRPPGPDWVTLLSTPGPGHDQALLQLHQLLVKATRHQVSQMYYGVAAIGAVRMDELVNQAADEAMVDILGKLSSFEGRSRFTTWAYKFGILHAAVEVRRNMWRHRDLDLDSVPERPAVQSTPEQLLEGTELAAAVGHAIEEALTPHQRLVVLALLVDDVPIDVLADRLGTTRNALYKALHDARGRLRAHLALAGYLPATPNTPRVIS
jgi:RNA polymerase sigma-70 factor, ECF subfamily